MALSNSFAFGGLNAVLVLRAARHPFDEIGVPPDDADTTPATGLVY